MHTTHVVAVLTLTLVVGAARQGRAQIRASERGSVSQTVDGTTIAVDYSRPQVRGRGDTLFGGVVPWGKVWTGANWATTIDVNHDITINGHPLTQGTYSVWLQVQRDAWTAIFDPEPRRFHLMPPPESDAQVRFTVRPEEGPHTEVLTWSFPAVRPAGTTLRLAWGTTAVQFEIGVPPSRSVNVSSEFASRYVGDYRMHLMGPLGDRDVAFTISYDGERLVARWESAPNPRLRNPWLMPLGAGMFAPVEVEDGKLWDVVTDLVLEFTPLEGRATSFELRALGDALWATGARAP